MGSASVASRAPAAGINIVQAPLANTYVSIPNRMTRSLMSSSDCRGPQYPVRHPQPRMVLAKAVSDAPCSSAQPLAPKFSVPLWLYTAC
jgi:hypothetical protein